MLDPLKTFISLLALVDPLAALPIFIALTVNYTAADKARVARTAGIAVVVIMTVAALLGGQIIALMGISIGAFKVGGGIILLLMALSMMNANTSGTRNTPAETEEAEHKHSVAVVPLALPILVGPGTISTIIILADKAATGKQAIRDFAVILGASALIGITVWLALRAAPRIAGFMGVTGINIATRVMGLLLAALAAEIMIDGVVSMVPALQTK